MALVIDDGSPWWLSPNVWVVDQSSPDDPSPGVVAPAVGATYLMKALVRNNGGFRVQNARVDMFWADPSIGITRANATAVGSAYVTVEANSTAEALCLVPWSPTFVNGGHICIVAAVVPPGASPTNALDAAADERVAQRNLDLVITATARFAVAFNVCNPTRMPARIALIVEPLDSGVLEPFGLERVATDLDAIDHLSFTPDRCPDQEQLLGRGRDRGKGKRSLRQRRAEEVATELELEAHACTGLTLIGELADRTPAAFSIVGRIGEREIGGITAVVMSEEGKLR